MNIALVTHEISTHSGSRSAIELAVRFARLGHPTYLYAYSRNSEQLTKNLIEKSGVTIFFLSRPQHIWQFPIWVYQTSNLIANRNHQIISVHASLILNLAVYFSRLPYVTTYYGSQWSPLSERPWPESIIKFLNPLANLIIWIQTFITLHLTSHIVTISRYCQTELLHFYKTRSQVIYLAGDSYFFTKNHKSPIANSQYSVTKLLSVSRITPYKNFHLLINCLKNIPSRPRWELIVAGSQPVPSYLQQLRNLSQGLPVKFIINPSDRFLTHLYDQTNLYLSADKYLFFGLPVAEASYHSIPSILFNYSAASELVNHRQTGYIANNSHQFSSYLIKLINNHGLTKHLGINAKRLSDKKFNWTLTSKEYLKTFRQIIKNPNP